MLFFSRKLALFFSLFRKMNHQSKVMSSSLYLSPSNIFPRHDKSCKIYSMFTSLVKLHCLTISYSWNDLHHYTESAQRLKRAQCLDAAVPRTAALVLRSVMTRHSLSHLVHPFTRARRRPEKLKETVFGILTVQGILRRKRRKRRVCKSNHAYIYRYLLLPQFY